MDHGTCALHVGGRLDCIVDNVEYCVRWFYTEGHKAFADHTTEFSASQRRVLGGHDSRDDGQARKTDRGVTGAYQEISAVLQLDAANGYGWDRLVFDGLQDICKKRGKKGLLLPGCPE